MNIEKLNRVEYEVLSCAYPDGGGYYIDAPHKTRAEEMMYDGLMERRTAEEISKSGWRLTDTGIAYRTAFMEAVKKLHGHRWMTKRETHPDLWGDDEYGNQIDVFAMSEGYHNGMKCAKCGYEFCKHCTCETDVPVCIHKEDE